MGRFARLAGSSSSVWHFGCKASSARRRERQPPARATHAHRRKEQHMRSLTWTSRLLAFGASVALWAGCDPMSSKEATSPSSDTWQQQDNFTDPTGGYTMRVEQQAFGDPRLVQIE